MDQVDGKFHIRIIRALEMRHVHWPALTKTSEQIVLFGSWSVAAERRDSDIDLFCVGNGARCKTRQVDIVYSNPLSLRKRSWLGSELANHIAKYGVWLHGQDDWTAGAFISAQALDFKRRLVRARVRALQRLWLKLGTDYRIKHVIKLRRDVQRLMLMHSRKAVMPTPLLDKWWQHVDPSSTCFHRMLQAIGEGRLLNKSQLELIADYLPRLNWEHSNARAAHQLQAVPRLEGIKRQWEQTFCASTPFESMLT